MASFQTKTGWRRPRKRENRNFVTINSYSTHNIELEKKKKKKSKAIQKIKKHHYILFSSQNWLAKAEKVIKLKLSS